MKLNELSNDDLNKVFLITVDHVTWNNRIIILEKIKRTGVVFYVVANSSSEIFDHGSFLGTDGDYKLLGYIKDYPEYLL